MAFSPDADANYQAYLKAANALSGPDRQSFRVLFVQYLSQQATATGTLNTAMITAALNAAKLSLKNAKNTFSFVPDNDANFQAFLKELGKYSDGEGEEFIHHFLSFHCQQASLSVAINSALASSAVSSARSATHAKRYTY